MKDKLHFEILDKKRIKLLPLFKAFKDRFYLAGGTALALQLAHRDSIDFDFFTDRDFNSGDLLREIKEVFTGHKIEAAQAGNKTLNIIIDGKIKASFFCINEKLLNKTINGDYFWLASLDDIACMKITALLRAELKDYIDLYYIMQQRSLAEIIKNCQRKYDNFDPMVYLKALISFDDINMPRILFRRKKHVKIKTIKASFQQAVKQYLGRLI
ncbi:MAG: nucleotidyl transferase AbiEii/AbiGii toxin family protein [Candidatus Margulisbacteria bacterium]|nr:nucleotidyl transferase AbiEii/AbiGii toxin family protein [Candidatus Margulisiibacteriota bacterium]